MIFKGLSVQMIPRLSSGKDPGIYHSQTQPKGAFATKPMQRENTMFKNICKIIFFMKYCP